MKTQKAYPNTLKGFKQWCKDHPWNSKYEAEKEYKMINTLYVELSLNDNSDGSLTAYCNIREYNPTKKSFQLVDKSEIGKAVLAHIQEEFEKYAKKHNASILPL